MGIAVALVRSSFLVDAVYAAAAREHGLTPQQGQLLCVLMPGARGMGELGAMLGLAKSSLTGLVDRTSERGLVRRAACPGDARTVRAELTAKGARVAEEFYAATSRRVEELSATLDLADREVLAELLARVVTANEVPAVFSDPEE
ncbi:MarR family transcriptional regulator [Actinomadura sp. PM05-2]|uniref:MarR family transcriptional regulator n=2 Tax=Actinomadura parmotrematis TaxID=2864039 RepID=A0ABS7G5W4_9ACTN|nr:MarR family transcriptional regulator [Actinomadura parmotrematis]